MRTWLHVESLHHIKDQVTLAIPSYKYEGFIMKADFLKAPILFLFGILATSAPYAATTYLATIDSSASSGYLDIHEPFQISGTIKFVVDGAFIQFESLDIATPPIEAEYPLISPLTASFDGLSFEAYYDPGTIPALGNQYAGTFDGLSLSMHGTYTNGFHLYEYTINSSSVSAIPLPGTAALFLSALTGLIVRRRNDTTPADFN